MPVKIRTWPTPTPEAFTIKPPKKSTRQRTTTYSPPRLPVAHIDEERPGIKKNNMKIKQMSNFQN